MSPEERRVQKVDPQLWEEIRKARVKDTFKLDPTVQIILKKKEYTLEFNNYAAKGILKDTLFNLFNGLDNEALKNPEIMGAVLYWGLKTYHPDMIQEDVDKLYTYRHYAYITTTLIEALVLFRADMSGYELSEPPISESPADPLKPSVVGG